MSLRKIRNHLWVFIISYKPEIFKTSKCIIKLQTQKQSNEGATAKESSPDGGGEETKKKGDKKKDAKAAKASKGKPNKKALETMKALINQRKEEEERLRKEEEERIKIEEEQVNSYFIYWDWKK